jgi:hypothetical protein
VQSLSPSQVTAVTEQPVTPPAPASNAPLSANNGSVAASNGSLTAGNGSLAAGNGSVAPGNGSVAAGNGSVAPGNGSVAASNGSVAAGTAPAAAPSSAFRVDDEQLVKQTLQRYRMAYEDRDASRARTVWPGVNQSALQRAFDGLESQRLTFDACDVQLRGTSATATCRGTLQYVPKVGSREVRTEPRIWNFNLQKSGDSWAIQNARADR